MSEELFYQGTRLTWSGQGEYKATSGLKGHQDASEQTRADEGPIPEGTYWFPVILAGQAKLLTPKNLDQRQGIESVPQTAYFGGIAYDLTAWGPDRVRLNVTHIDDSRASHRGGFYLHDSTKGYSHGCIEVQPDFFVHLRAYAKLVSRKKFLHLRVRYPSSDASTNGQTKVP